MRSVILMLLCIAVTASSQEKEVAVTGKLTRAVAIGGESTGWSVEFESEITVEGKPLHSIEVRSRDSRKLQSLENKRVRAAGKIAHVHGVERGDYPVLDISSIEPLSRVSLGLTGTEWQLKDLGDTEALTEVQATLAFSEGEKVSGHASCNRFFGTAQINGNSIKFGPLGATRMFCSGRIMEQEAKYLNALQSAERFERKNSELLLFCKGLEKPLRFARK